MSTIKYRELRRRYELDGAERTVSHLSEALDRRELRPEDFSFRDLAESLIPDGREWVRTLNPRGGSMLLESSDGVDLTAFLNVSNQVIYSKILDSYTQETFVASKLVETIPTRFDGEKIPGVGRIPDDAAEVAPGMPYHNVGFGEDYIETPKTTKRGLIVPVTREAVFFDQTNLVLSRAAEVGEILGLNKEKRLIDILFGITNSYKWNGTSYNTYYSSSESGPWANKLGSNAFSDWTSVDAAEQVFSNILDPTTQEPVLIQPNTLFVLPSVYHTAKRTMSATEVHSTSGGQTTITSNPLSSYQVVSSRIALSRLSVANNTSHPWLLGNFRKAFCYMENWPITVTHSVAPSEADFNQDILVRFKASERGAAAVLNPRYVVMSTD
ncbi:MAG: hypothetical protein PHE53_02405 [Thermoguttaceae bacterium]|nr:hypothetical protein [Thermoguttaceae bacterium]